MTKYKILDWAGNDKTPYFGEFKTPDDAWDAVYKFIDELPEIMAIKDEDDKEQTIPEYRDEYVVEEIKRGN